MSNEIAIIIAAIITVGGTVITFSINVLFNVWANKKASQERLFYYVIPMRLEFYKDVSGTVSKFLFEYKMLEFETTRSAGNFINKICNELSDLNIRSITCASKKVHFMLNKLLELSIFFNDNGLSEEKIDNSKIAAKNFYNKFLTACEPINDNLLIQIRIESGAEAIDKMILDSMKMSEEKNSSKNNNKSNKKAKKTSD